jgi:hypothetical protein
MPRRLFLSLFSFSLSSMLLAFDPALASELRHRKPSVFLKAENRTLEAEDRTSTSTSTVNHTLFNSPNTLSLRTVEQNTEEYTPSILVNAFFRSSDRTQSFDSAQSSDSTQASAFTNSVRDETEASPQSTLLRQEKLVWKAKSVWQEKPPEETSEKPPEERTEESGDIRAQKIHSFSEENTHFIKCKEQSKRKDQMAVIEHKEHVEREGISTLNPPLHAYSATRYLGWGSAVAVATITTATLMTAALADEQPSSTADTQESSGVDYARSSFYLNLATLGMGACCGCLALLKLYCRHAITNWDADYGKKKGTCVRNCCWLGCCWFMPAHMIKRWLVPDQSDQLDETAVHKDPIHSVPPTSSSSQPTGIEDEEEQNSAEIGVGLPAPALPLRASQTKTEVADDKV